MSALKHRCFKLQWSQLAVWLDKKLHITSCLRETVTTLLLFRSVGVWRFPCSAATACESQIGEEGRWWVSYLHWGYSRLLCRMNRACSISLEELGVLCLDVCGPLKIITQSQIKSQNHAIQMLGEKLMNKPMTLFLSNNSDFTVGNYPRGNFCSCQVVCGMIVESI